MTIRLDVGCGDACAPGWTGVDPFYDAPGMVKAPADSLPYNDGAVDAIRMSHALEHLALADVPAALAEFWRVLRHGGTLEITVPDALFVLQYALDNPDADWARVMIWGQGRWDGDAHLSAWTPDTLRDALIEARFRVTSVRQEWTPQHQQLSIIAEAIRG